MRGLCHLHISVRSRLCGSTWTHFSASCFCSCSQKKSGWQELMQALVSSKVMASFWSQSYSTFRLLLPALGHEPKEEVVELLNLFDI